MGVKESDTEYAKTKLAADNYLQHLNIDWIILRPSLVYASNSFGGTSLLRALSVLPIIPLIGNGFQKFQPIHIEDLSKSSLSILRFSYKMTNLRAIKAIFYTRKIIYVIIMKSILISIIECC